MRQGAAGHRVMFRLALRDAGEILRSRTYLGLFFAPLLLVGLLGLLVLVVTAMLVAIQLATPSQEGSPLGHDKIAVVLEATDYPRRVPYMEELVQFLREEPPAPPEEARLFRRFVRFLSAAREASEGHPVAGEGAAQGLSTGAVMPGAVSSGEGGGVPAEELGSLLTLEVITDQAWNRVKQQVPSTYDVALRLEPARDGSLRYELEQEPGLLYSRLMARRVQSRLEAFNLERGKNAPRQLREVRVVERRVGAPDLWGVKALLLLGAFGLAFTYHSVGVQSVAGVLAGERDARTLDTLLSLPITRRQILYGKLLGLLLTSALPTLFWSGVLWVPMALLFGVTLPYGPLCVLLVSLLALLMASGCAVSAASPDVMSAKNRLGMTNLISLMAGGGLLGLPASVWPVGWHPVSLLLTALSGSWSAWTVLLVLSVGCWGVAAVILELGLWGWKRLA